MAGVLRQRQDVLTEFMPDGSAILYDGVHDQGHVLDKLGALVWDMCDGTMSPRDIAQSLAALDPHMAALLPAVDALLTQFAQLGLLAPDEGAA